MAYGASGNFAALQSAGQLSSPIGQATQSVQGSATAAATVATSALGAQVQGAMNIVWIGCSVAGDITSVTDSNGNTYTACVSSATQVAIVQTNGLYNLYAYQARVKNGAAGNVVTANFSASINAWIGVSEYQNVGTVALQTLSATGTTTGSTVTIYAPQSSAVIVACAIGDAATAPTAGAGFTAQLAGNSTPMAYLVEDQLLTSFATGNAGVVAATVGIAATTWTTISLTLTPYVLLEGAAGLNFSFGFFFNCPTLPSSTSTIFLIVGSYAVDSVSVTVSSTNVINFITNAGGTTTTIGTTLVANTWYFFGATITNYGSKMVVFLKKVGAPSCTRTVIATGSSFNTSEVAAIMYLGSIPSTTPSGSAGVVLSEQFVGSLRSFFLYPNLVLTGAEMDRQSENLSLVRTAGIGSFQSLVDMSHVNSEAGGMLQFASVITGTGVLATTSEPPLAEFPTSRRVRKRARRKQDVLFFNGPFASSEAEKFEGGLLTPRKRSGGLL